MKSTPGVEALLWTWVMFPPEASVYVFVLMREYHQKIARSLAAHEPGRAKLPESGLLAPTAVEATTEIAIAYIIPCAWRVGADMRLTHGLKGQGEGLQ